MGINMLPDTQPFNQKVSDRRIWALGLGRCAAVEVDGVIDQLPVVLGLGIGKAKGGIHIALTNHMGHAANITFDHHIVFVAETLIVGSWEFLGTARG